MGRETRILRQVGVRVLHFLVKSPARACWWKGMQVTSWGWLVRPTPKLEKILLANSGQLCYSFSAVFPTTLACQEVRGKEVVEQLLFFISL